MIFYNQAYNKSTVIIESPSRCLNLNINVRQKFSRYFVWENDIRHMATKKIQRLKLSLCTFFPECLAECSVTWFNHCELWIEKVFDETFWVGKLFYMAPTWLYLVEMPKIPKLFAFTSATYQRALLVSKFRSMGRLFAW